MVKDEQLVQIGISAKAGGMEKAFFIGQDADMEDIANAYFVLSQICHHLITNYNFKEDFKINRDNEEESD